MDPGPNHLMVEYTPALAEQRLRQRASALRWSFFGLGFLVVLILAVMIYNRHSEPWKVKEYQIWLSVLAGLAVVRIIWASVRYLLARRYLTRLPQGLALVVSRDGIACSQHAWAWPAIRSISTRRRVTRGPDFEIYGHDGAEPFRLPVEDLTAFGATIDSAVRIYSGGRCRIDLSGIDR